MTERAVAVLFVEDSESDVELAVSELRRAGVVASWERVTDAHGLRDALLRQAWDLVIADASIPQCGEAFAVTRDVAPATPFLVSSATREDASSVAIDILRELALRKDNAPAGVARLLITAQENEARRIARDLHDRVGQQLVSLSRTLDAAEQDPAQLAAARALVERSLRSSRELATDLWPSILDDHGLVAALRWLAERHTAHYGGTMCVDAPAAVDTPPSIAAALYRVASEALTNVGRHASADNVVIELRAGLEVELIVRDDGVGFDAPAAWERSARGDRVGLLWMRERMALIGGTFELVSSPGAGTVVRASVRVAR